MGTFVYTLLSTFLFLFHEGVDIAILRENRCRYNHKSMLHLMPTDTMIQFVNSYTLKMNFLKFIFRWQLTFKILKFTFYFCKLKILFVKLFPTEEIKCIKRHFHTLSFHSYKYIVKFHLFPYFLKPFREARISLRPSLAHSRHGICFVGYYQTSITIQWDLNGCAKHKKHKALSLSWSS